MAVEITERTNISFIFRVERMTWLFSGPIHLNKICQRIFRCMFCAVYLRYTRKYGHGHQGVKLKRDKCGENSFRAQSGVRVRRHSH